jgi:hypothetical protein
MHTTLNNGLMDRLHRSWRSRRRARVAIGVSLMGRILLPLVVLALAGCSSTKPGPQSQPVVHPLFTPKGVHNPLIAVAKTESQTETLPETLPQKIERSLKREVLPAPVWQPRVSNTAPRPVAPPVTSENTNVTASLPIQQTQVTETGSLATPADTPEEPATKIDASVPEKAPTFANASWLSLVGFGLFLLGVATFLPPLSRIIEGMAIRLAILLGAVALIVLPRFIVGHELLILSGVLLAMGAFFAPGLLQMRGRSAPKTNQIEVVKLPPNYDGTNSEGEIRFMVK